MPTFSKSELAAIKAKEQTNRENAIAASKVHDAAVMDSIKSRLGMGQPQQAAPAPQPAPQAAPAPQATPGMKKGGKVAGQLATRGYGIAKGGKK